MPSLEQLLRKREQCIPYVYNDKLKNLTCGIGHLVMPGDKLKLHDKVDDSQISAFFKKDSAKAMSAARSQASKAGIKDSDFITYLASVNFQLGTGWNRIFKKTWALIMEGQYKAAAEEAQRSRWYTQTPERVKDFQKALLKLKDKPSEREKK